MISLLDRFLSHRFAPLLAFLLIALTGAYILNGQYDKIKANEANISRILATQGRIQAVQGAALYGACHRLNIFRAAENTSHYADYRFFTLTTKLLEHPVTIRPITTAEAKATRHFIAQLKRSANAKTWIALTPCSVSLTNPRYSPPPAVAFSKRLPPQQVYQVGPGE